MTASRTAFRCTFSTVRRHLPVSLLCALATGAAFLSELAATPAAADNWVVRVEEDWVVEIATPDPAEDSPQIITAMSSTGQLADVHALFELNHRTLPAYTAGGMALQLWSGDTNLDARPGPKSEELVHENEVISYTTSMKLSGGSIAFEVLNGNSTTWGTFGGQGYLKTSAPTTQTSLWQYSPDVSVANSKVGFAKHRVKKFSLKRVRYYNSDNQLLWTDNTERVVHELPATP